ncbi:MAG: hypothetical protein H7062_11655 [Candidatus Saccharimonas sp.]|nr:hypothetical protein [Planctomycetaceae bacterium]
MDTTPTDHRANVPAIIVGVFILLTAFFGLWYNAMSMIGVLAGASDPLLKQFDLPFFYHAYYAMSGICVFCYVVLLVCGVDLIRSRLRWSRLVTLVLVFEMGYFLAVGSLWLEPTIGRSVGAATGVANGGMMAQFIILLPLWGPLLLWWAKSRQQSRAAPDLK